MISHGTRPVNVPATLASFNLGFTYTVSFIAGFFGGMLSTLMSVYLPVTVVDLLGYSDAGQIGTVGAFINAMFLFGWAVGGIIWGILGDVWGRSKVLALTIGFYAFFALLTGTASSWPLLVGYRFLTGIGVGGMLVITYTFVAEIWPERSRPVAMGILSVAFPLGIFSAGALNLGIDEWRQAFLVAGIPAFLAVLAWIFLPESEKWKSQRASETGTVDHASLRDPELRMRLVMGSIIFGMMLIGLWAVFSWLPTWVESLLPNSDSQSERGISMMIMGSCGIAGGFLSGLVVKGLGLYRTMVLCYTACFILAMLLFMGNTVFSQVIYFQLALLAVFFGISQGSLGLFIPLLFPVALRASATGLCFNFGRFVTATAVFFVGALAVVFNGYGNAISFFSGVFLIGLITLILLKTGRHTSFNDEKI